MISKLSVVHPEAKIGGNVRIYDFVNIYGISTVGDESFIGAFVEIQPQVEIGRKVKVSSHSFICTGVTIEDEVFIGHGVMFTNDKYPKSVEENGDPVYASTTNVIPTLIKQRASIGSNATILSGLTIGEGAIVGAGSVVTKDVEANTTVCGNPAKVVKTYK